MQAESRLGRAVDFVSDWSVLAFASWTLIGYGGMLTTAPVTALVAVWIVTIPLLALALVLLHRRRDRGELMPQRGAAPVTRAGGYRSVLVPALLAAGLAAGALAFYATDVPWPLVWLPLFGAVVLAVALAWPRVLTGTVDRAHGLVEHAAAASVGVVFAGLALLVHRPSADDVYYVNRATATAELGHIPVRDVLVTNEQAPPASGVGLPVDTFSALQGALARVVDVHAASVAYYVSPPLFTFLATWALWRLVREWAPRAAIVCFALGCVYWLFTAQDFLTPGSYFLPRMWQGKVIFVAWLVPTVYVHLTRWLGQRDALTATVLLGAGVSSIGLTGSATFVMPLLVGTAVLVLLARREWNALPVVVAAAAFPFLVGFVATRRYPLAEVFAGGGIDTSYVFTESFATGTVAAVGALALCFAPWLARPPWGMLATSGVAGVGVLVLAPGVLQAVSDVSGLTDTLRRTLWILPLPGLVALLAAIPVPRVPSRFAALVPAVLVGALLVLAGHPVWTSASGDSRIRFPPEWKTPMGSLRDARAILGSYEGPGPILADKQVMKAIALLTADPKAVTPRGWYVKLIEDRRVQVQRRLRLERLMTEEGRQPTAEELEQDLAVLRVALVCVPDDRDELLRDVESAGPYAEAFRVRGNVCLERRPG